MSMDEATRAQFELLRQRFLAGLAQRMSELDAAPDDGARCLVLHRLAGAAGSYGCEVLGRLARQAEAALRSPSGGLPDAAAQALRQLRVEVQRLRS